MIIIVVMYQFFGESFNFKSLNEDVYLYFSLFIVLGALVEIMMILIMRQLYNNTIAKVDVLRVPASFGFIVMCMSVIILYMAFIFASEYGVVSEEFENKMASGFVGHALVFLMVTPPFIYLSYVNKNIKKITFIFLMFLVYFCLFLKQVKSWIMIPSLYFFLMYIYFNKIRVRRFLIYSFYVSIVLLIFFFSVYYFKSFIANPNSDAVGLLGQIYQHFLFYLFSGVGAFSEYLKENHTVNFSDWSVLVLPVVNVINFFSGSPMESAINPVNYIINNEMQNKSNVFTMFGTLWMYLDYFSLLFYALLVAFQSMLYISRSNVISCSVYWLITSFGFFSWFEYYYFHLASYEAPLYVLILSILFLGKNSEKQMCYSNT
ncbi:DUF6337 family protein [Kosakonia cowanii]